MNLLKNFTSFIIFWALCFLLSALFPRTIRAQEIDLLKNNKNTSSIELTQALAQFKKNKDVVVAVIDTGVDPNQSFLKQNLWSNGKAGNLSDFGKDFSKNATNINTPFDHHGHGTHIAGIIKSIYSDVKILSLKYYNPKASGEENLEATIKALRYAVTNNVDIINYSGGGPEASKEELELLQEAQKKGILVVAASGNDGQNIDLPKNAYYPASYGPSNTITVTAHDEFQKLLPTSNYGVTHVDISAPGNRVKSTLPNNRVGYLTGTSQATAYVSGVAALLKAQYPTLKPEEIKQILVNSATKSKQMKGLSSSGGLLNAQTALITAASWSVPTLRNVAQTNLNRNKRKKGKIIYRSIHKS